ncbi:MAG: DUF192 domain-containing protein [Nanoarchaeota archaeon]|nr:DUF192 domain-containing protein [Nanoarchaeota archaeon]
MIKNQTKNKILAEDFKLCNSEFEKLKGLMFTKKISKALVFVSGKEQNISMHMFFVFYPIDVLWLNKNKKIIQIKKDFRPFRISKGCKARYVIELEKGTIEKTKTETGDIVRFK